jgi:hypothetical protein
LTGFFFFAYLFILAKLAPFIIFIPFAFNFIGFVVPFASNFIFLNFFATLFEWAILTAEVENFIFNY